MYEIKATSIIKQTLPMLIVMGLGGTLAGLFLSSSRATLDVFPGLLVLVPAMQNLRGSISGSLASRLSTALHQGTVRASFSGNEELTMYALASISLSAAMSFIIGVLAFAFTKLWQIPSATLLQMITISFVVGLLAGIVHLFVNLLVSITSFKNGLDPDNIAIPALAIIGDIVTILYFMIVVGWVM